MDASLKLPLAGGRRVFASPLASTLLRLLAVAAAVGGYVGLALAGQPWLGVVVCALAAAALWYAVAPRDTPVLSFPWLISAGIGPRAFALACLLAAVAFFAGYFGLPQQVTAALWVGAMLAALAAGKQSQGVGQAAGGSAWFSRVDLAAVVAIGLLAFALRAWRLDLYPNGFHGDEGVFGLESWAALRGKGPPFFGVGEWNHPAGYFHLYAFWQALLGYGQLSLRLGDAVNGTVLVGLTYYLGREMFNRRVGAVAAWLVCCSISYIIFSRQALGLAALQTLWAGSFLALWHGLKHGSGRSLVLAGALGGLGFYTTFAALSWVPTVAVFAVMVLLLTREIRVYLRPALLFGLGYLTAFAPLAEAYTDVWAHSESRLLASDPRQMIELAGTTDLLPVYWANLQVNLRGLFVAAQHASFFLPELPMLQPLEGALFVLGAIYALLRLRDLRFLLLLCWLVVMFICNAEINGISPQAHRLWFGMGPMLLLAAVVIDDALFTAEPLPGHERLSAGARCLLPAAAVVLLTINAYGGVRSFFTFGEKMMTWETATAQSLYARQMGTHTAVGVLGDPVIYFEHPSTRFLAPDAVGRNVTAFPEDLDKLRALGKPIAFIVYPYRTKDLPRLREAFPGGQSREIVLPKPEPHVVFTIYCTEGTPPPLELPPPDPVVEALFR